MKANEAVSETNLDQVQHGASLIWADAYLNPDIKKVDITESYNKYKKYIFEFHLCNMLISNDLMVECCVLFVVC